MNTNTLLNYLNNAQLTTLISPGIALMQLGVGLHGYEQKQDYANALSVMAELEASDVAQQYALARAQTTSFFAAAGVDVNTGTPLDLMAANAERAAMAESIIRYNFAVRRSRAESEGFADLMAGISGAIQTGVTGLHTALTAPRSAPKQSGIVLET